VINIGRLLDNQKIIKQPNWVTIRSGKDGKLGVFLQYNEPEINNVTELLDSVHIQVNKAS
jgi:hypothetical protein